VSSYAPPPSEKEQQVAFAPIFIVGVPRSGTTLLRVLLDSHSQILALPETPWLLGTYGGDASLRGLLNGLWEGRYGLVRNVAGMEREHVRQAGLDFLDSLFRPVLVRRGKKIVAFKTPADIRHLDFVTEFLPDARYIHITRDGRDVAMSQLAKKGSFFHDLREYRRLSYANVFRRWVDWEQKVRTTLYRGGLKVIHLRYEDLIANPERELRRVMDFLGLPFERTMLDYASQDHDYPAWEAGSTDVAGHSAISAASVAKWRGAKMSVEMLHTLLRYDSFLIELGYPSSQLKPGWGARMAVAGFPLVKPLLDGVSRFYRGWMLPALRDPNRILACVALLALAAPFLLLGGLFEQWGLSPDTYQPLFSFGASLYFLMTAAPALNRRSGAGLAPILLRLDVGLLAYIAFLGWAQESMSGGGVWLKDFLLNATAVIAALIVSKLLLSKTQSRTRPA
jgi:hypothetical protein